MKKKSTMLLIAVLFIAGIGILLYPTISNWIAVYSQDMTIRYYDDAINQVDPEVIASAWEKARDFNAMQTGVTFADPFNEHSGDALAEGYLSVLNFNGVMGYVEIPKIDVYLPIYHGTAEPAISKGVGHLAGSGLPIGGNGNHAVLTSHSGLPSAKLFTDLELMELGDVFYIRVLGDVLFYAVDQILIVEPDDIEALLPVEGEDYVTLITCTPYAINSHRLLVRGTRVALAAGEVDTMVRQSAKRNVWLRRIAPAAAIVTALLIIRAIYRKHKKKRKKSGRG